jgi:polar amino acid transport system substrate-binding protein
MPFNGTPGDSRPGYVIEIAQKIFSAHGVTLDYQTLPWEQALKSARESSIEAVIGANEKEAAGLIVPQEPVGAPRMALFTMKKTEWRYENLASLSTVRLGVIAGYSYWDALDQYIATHQGVKIVVFDGDTPLHNAIKKLNTGELDVVAESISVFIWTVKANGFSPADYRMAFSYEGEPIFMAFAPTDQGRQYAAWFDQGLRDLRKSGTLTSILAGYGLSDWK